MAPKKKKKDKSGYKQDPGRGELNKTGRDIPSNLLQVTGNTPEYYKAAEEGTFANIPNVLDEVVIVAGNDYNKQPNFNSLTKSERKLSKGKGAIGRALRQKARGEKPSQMTTASFLGGIAEGVGSLIQAPQSLAVEGIEKMRGNPSSFKNAVTPGKQRTPSQTMGLEDKPGWDVGGSLNTAMDVIADPSNLFGIGAASKIMKGAKNVPKLSKKVFSNISRDGLNSLAKRPSVSPNADFSDITDLGSTIKKSIIPETPLSDNTLLDGVSMLFGGGKKQIKQLDPLIRELAKGAPTANSMKDFTLQNLTSTQGQQRLYNESLANLKLADKKGKLSVKQLDKKAKKEVKWKTKAFKNVTNINDDLAKAIGSDGKINRRKAIKAIYSDYKGATLVDNASAMKEGERFSLGTNFTNSKNTAAHELQHNLQFGDATALDDEFNTLKSIPGFKRDEDYFRTGGNYYGARSKEPRAFGAELRQSMLDRGLITNKKGTWSEITEESLKKAKKSFYKKPKGDITPTTGFSSGTRLLDFTDPTDFKKLATSMNKLTGAVAPVAIGGAGLSSMFGKKKK